MSSMNLSQPKGLAKQLPVIQTKLQDLLRTDQISSESTVKVQHSFLDDVLQVVIDATKMNQLFESCLEEVTSLKKNVDSLKIHNTELVEDNKTVIRMAEKIEENKESVEKKYRQCRKQSQSKMIRLNEEWQQRTTQQIQRVTGELDVQNRQILNENAQLKQTLEQLNVRLQETEEEMSLKTTECELAQLAIQDIKKKILSQTPPCLPELASMSLKGSLKMMADCESSFYTDNFTKRSSLQEEFVEYNAMPDLNSNYMINSTKTLSSCCNQAYGEIDIIDLQSRVRPCMKNGVKQGDFRVQVEMGIQTD